MKPRAWEMWIGGWCSLFDGVVLIVTFGFLRPNCRYEWTMYRLQHRDV